MMEKSKDTKLLICDWVAKSLVFLLIFLFLQEMTLRTHESEEENENKFDPELNWKPSQGFSQSEPTEFAVKQEPVGENEIKIDHDLNQGFPQDFHQEQQTEFAVKQELECDCEISSSIEVTIL